MPVRLTLILAAMCVTVGFPSSVLTQVLPEGAGSTNNGGYDHNLVPVALATRLSQEITVNGVLDESAWTAASPIADLTQTLPNEGDPVSEYTEVRVLYDDAAIYIGVRLDDRSPVTTRLARRDSGLGDSDRFVLMLDSYHDHETAYRFWTNPSGVKGML